MGEIIVNILLSLVLIIVAGFYLHAELTRKQKRLLVKIFLATVALLILQFCEAETFDELDHFLFPGTGYFLRLLCYLAIYLYIGRDTLLKALRGIVNGQFLDENFLMLVATAGALSLAIYENGDYLEAIAVMLFYKIGTWFEDYAVSKSRKNIAKVMDIRPDFARLMQNNVPVQVTPDQVPLNSEILVLTGEKVPLDGIILSGSTLLNTAVLTGESLPKEANTGDEIMSGVINLGGELRIRTTREFADSTVSKIMEMVESASSKRSVSENFISKFARYYTPVICSFALFLCLIPPCYQHFIQGQAYNFHIWIYRALTFLVISCPCALVISIPLSFFAAIGGLNRVNVLVKGSNYLEQLAKTKIIAFDKTSTLTEGKYEITGIHHSVFQCEQIIDYMALAESSSRHPIARSIITANGKPLNKDRIKSIREFPGQGVVAHIDNISIACGNSKLMENLHITYHECSAVGTVVHIAIDKVYCGHLLIRDIINPTSTASLNELRNLGITRQVILTGDGEKITGHIAKEIGFDEYYTGLLPQEKLTRIEQLLKEKNPAHVLAFVGDGIYDTPMLAKADIGIAMGILGSDAAIDAAKVVLMDNDLRKIPAAINHARKTLGIVRQNIIATVGIKSLCLICGAFGISNMYLAIFADVGVMILAILNAMRCIFVKTY